MNPLHAEHSSPSESLMVSSQARQTGKFWMVSSPSFPGPSESVWFSVGFGATGAMICFRVSSELGWTEVCMAWAFAGVAEVCMAWAVADSCEAKDRLVSCSCLCMCAR